jgi:hypothetical protein
MGVNFCYAKKAKFGRLGLSKATKTTKSHFQYKKDCCCWESYVSLGCITKKDGFKPISIRIYGVFYRNMAYTVQARNECEA